MVSSYFPRISTLPLSIAPSTALVCNETWTAPADGRYHFDTAGSTFDTVLYLLDGTYSQGASGPGAQGIKLHIGTYNVSNEDFYYVHLADMTSSGLGLSAVDLTSTANAQSAIDTMDGVIDVKDTERTRIGSFVSRLQMTVANLQIARENAVASESMVRDADMAEEMAAFTRAQILMQSGIAMQAQANQLPQLVAQLIG